MPGVEHRNLRERFQSLKVPEGVRQEETGKMRQTAVLGLLGKAGAAISSYDRGLRKIDEQSAFFIVAEDLAVGSMVEEGGQETIDGGHPLRLVLTQLGEPDYRRIAIVNIGGAREIMEDPNKRLPELSVPQISLLENAIAQGVPISESAFQKYLELTAGVCS